MSSQIPSHLSRLVIGLAVSLQCVCAAEPRDHRQSPSRMDTVWQRNEAERAEAYRIAQSLLHRPLTAATAAEIALLNNRELQASLEEIGLSQADVLEAGLLKNPGLDLESRMPVNISAPVDLAGSVAFDLLDLMMRPLRRRMAKDQLAKTELRVTDVVVKLVAETKAALYEVEAQEQLAGALRTSVQAAAAETEMAQRQFDAGNIPELQLAIRRAHLPQARIELAVAEAELRSKREQLNRRMGVWGESTHWKTSGKLPSLPAKEIVLDGLESFALDQRADLAATKVEAATAAAALGLTKRYRYLGALEIGASSERDTENRLVAGPTLRLEAPLFNQGQGRIARGEARLRQAEDRLEAETIEIRSEVREKRDALVARRAQVELYRDQLLPELAHISSLTLLQYNAMLLGVYDLLESKQRELETERAMIEALRGYWVTRAELERAVGGSFDRERHRAIPTDAQSAPPPSKTTHSHHH